MKKLIQRLLGMTIALSTASFAAGKGPAKATVQVTSSQEKGATKLHFKTLPADGLVVNAEGPWKLEIKNATGIKPSVTELKRADWKQDLAGFELPVTPDAKAKSAEVQFKLTTFVCTKDKSQCFREVVEDKVRKKGTHNETEIKKGTHNETEITTPWITTE